MKTEIQEILSVSLTLVELTGDPGSCTLQAYWHQPFLIGEGVFAAHGTVSKDLQIQIYRTVG